MTSADRFQFGYKDNRKKQDLHIRLDETLFELLQARAKEKNATISKVTREIISEGLA